MKLKKNKQIIFTIVLGIIFLLVGYLIGQDNKPSTKLPGQLELSDSFFDFGTVGLDPVEHSFTIKNVGEGELNISKVSTSCGCTTAQLEKQGEISSPFGMDHGNLPPANFSLLPGEEGKIKVTYNPLAHGLQNARGTFRRMVYIRTENPKKEYTLTINVTVDPDLQVKKDPKISVKGDSYDFGKIAKSGGVVSTSFVVRNEGREDLKIENISTSCGCTSAEIEKNIIEPGQSTELTVRFDPDFHKEPQGKLERTVTLFTNDPDNPEFNLKIYAEIID